MNHLKITLQIKPGMDLITGISEALKIVKAIEKRQFVDIGKDILVMVRPESDVQDLIHVAQLELKLKKISSEK